jgi:fluoride exporter
MIFLGGGLGSLCRYGVTLGCKPLETLFPYATLIANGLSCIILGVCVTLANANALNPQMKLMIMTGFCGGFSTYSTFTNETYQLFENSHYAIVLLNIFGNLSLCFICLYFGLNFGKVLMNSGS